ncbi:MAG: DUF4282 domain-containing protein [Pseudomonadota bacterium]
MMDFSELLQWDRFITPSVIRVFYWLCLAVVALTGLSLILTALGMMAINMIAELLLLAGAMVFTLAGIIFVRILCEIVMVIFRINEHLGAIRYRGVDWIASAPPERAGVRSRTGSA